ncbi:MAG: hypothetical protein E7181_01960 [Erysipelotrichaceae bacterium]|nr:hypothetical protein [Erysipelotrichaceae bacterium]
MKKKRFNTLNIVTIAVITLTLIMSFIPVNPWSTGGDPTYYSFCQRMVEANTRSPAFLVMGIIFYIASILVIVFIAFGKKAFYIASLGVATVGMSPFLARVLLINYFAIAVMVAYIALLTAHLFFLRYRNKED